MPKASTQRLPAVERRELLLDAAAEQFATHGYHATDVTSIAAATGVTKVIAYRAFGSKQAIYQTLLDLHRDQLLATLVASQQTEHTDMAHRIRAGLDAWFGYVQRHPFAWKLLFRDTTGLADLEAHHRAMRAEAREVIARLLVEHFSVRATEAAPTAEFLRSAVVGLALWWLENPLVRRGKIVHTAQRLVTGVLQQAGLSTRSVE
jgi:AcrR family transcriptional regulator